MSVLGPSRLAKDCSVMDAASGGPSPNLRHLTATDGEPAPDEPLPSKIPSHSDTVSGDDLTCPADSAGPALGIEGTGSGMTGNLHDDRSQEVQGQVLKPGVRASIGGEVQAGRAYPHVSEPHLESFASALEYVLQQMKEEDGGKIFADRLAVPSTRPASPLCTHFVKDDCSQSIAGFCSLSLCRQ